MQWCYILFILLLPFYFLPQNGFSLFYVLISWSFNRPGGEDKLIRWCKLQLPPWATVLVLWSLTDVSRQQDSNATNFLSLLIMAASMESNLCGSNSIWNRKFSKLISFLWNLSFSESMASTLNELTCKENTFYVWQGWRKNCCFRQL